MGEPTRRAIMRVTRNGHEFLANAKNDTIWKEVLVEAEKK
jgi:hypothetical protein